MISQIIVKLNIFPLSEINTIFRTSPGSPKVLREGHYHTENSLLICRANQCIGLWMIETSIMKKVNV